jgi:hypothetical protein
MMKEKIPSSLVIFIVFIFVDFIFFKLRIYFGENLKFSIIYFISSTILIFLLFENLIYNKLFSIKSGKYKLIIFIIIPLIISMFIIDRLKAINKSFFF